MKEQFTIHDVMNSALDNYCKSRFISWVDWYGGNIDKAFDKLKMIVEIQINLCQWYQQTRKEYFEKMRDVLYEIDNKEEQQ